jgi:protein SCO1/2
MVTPLFAQDNVAQQQQAIQNPDVGFTDNTGDYLPEDIMLINKNDSLVSLGELIDKPTVLTFVYYDCPGICTPLLNELAALVDQIKLELGKDYQILTVSFDPSEPTRLAQQKKKNIMSTVKKQEQAGKGWKFFTADSAQVVKLTNAAGFHYKPQGTEFVHSGGFIAVSPEGKITRYLKGVSFLPFELKMTMVEASKGEVGPPVNKVLQYCFAFDPKGQTYVADITKISGIIILFFALLLLIVLVIRQNRKRSKAKA